MYKKNVLYDNPIIFSMGLKFKYIGTLPQDFYKVKS